MGASQAVAPGNFNINLAVGIQPQSAFTMKPLQSLFSLTCCKKGAALLEYSLLAAGVSLFGHQTNGFIAAVLPGAHEDDNGMIGSGKLIETTAGGVNPNTLDASAIATTNAGTAGLVNNLGALAADLELPILES